MIQQLIHSWERRKSLRKFASNIPTGLHPLSAFHTAALILDFQEMDWEKAKIIAEDFFGKRGIKVNFYYNDFASLNWYGRLKTSKTNPNGICDEDLFISLMDSDEYFVRFAAVSSRAITKVGRIQLPGDIFDIVVKGPEEAECSQSDTLGTVIEMLSLIK